MKNQITIRHIRYCTYCKMNDEVSKDHKKADILAQVQKKNKITSDMLTQEKK